MPIIDTSKQLISVYFNTDGQIVIKVHATQTGYDDDYIAIDAEEVDGLIKALRRVKRELADMSNNSVSISRQD